MRLFLPALIATICLNSPAEGRTVPLTASLKSSGYSPVLYRRGVAVYRDKHVKETAIAAEASFPVPPERLLKALLAYERHKGVIDRVAESRVLKRSTSELLVYQRLNLPVISDRDFTLKVRWGKEEGTHWLRFATTSLGPAPRKSIVRLKRHAGSWQLKPIGDGGTTWARYQVNIQLGGYLPAWLARSSAGKELPQLFGALCRLAATQAERSKCP